MKSTAEITATEKELIFWQRYRIVSEEMGLSEKQCEQYIIWVRRFINYNKGKQLAECSQPEVAAFLDNLALSMPSSEDWQRRQASDALRVLYQRILHAPWSSAWDWPCADAPDNFISPYPDMEEPAQNRVCKISDDTQYIPFLEKLRAVMGARSYSVYTIQAYESWIKRFVAYHSPRAPEKLDHAAAREYLEFLAADRKIAASTHNQAAHALKFLYKNVLEKTPDKDIFSSPGVPRRIPEVLNRQEIRRLLHALTGMYAVMGGLLYGSGLQTSECAGLRVGNIDFENQRITVQPESAKERTTVLAEKFRPMLHRQLEKTRKTYENDTERGYVEMCEWEKYCVFPSPRLSVDQKTGKIHRYHININSLQKAVRDAALKAGLTKPVNCRTLRHSFIAHLLESGYDVRTVQELAGHRNVSATLAYMNVLNRPGSSVTSPADI